MQKKVHDREKVGFREKYKKLGSPNRGSLRSNHQVGRHGMDGRSVVQLDHDGVRATTDETSGMTASWMDSGGSAPATNHRGTVGILDGLHH